jgi:hypothetical protein
MLTRAPNQNRPSSVVDHVHSFYFSRGVSPCYSGPSCRRTPDVEPASYIRTPTTSTATFTVKVLRRRGGPNGRLVEASWRAYVCSSDIAGILHPSPSELIVVHPHGRVEVAASALRILWRSDSDSFTGVRPAMEES